jgi:hypothetical protein
MLYFQLVILAGTVMLAYYFEYTDTFSVHVQGFFCYDSALTKPYLGGEERSAVPPALLYALVAGLPTLMVRTHRAALPVHVNAALSFRPVTPRAGARDERLCCMSCRRCSVAAHKPFASDLMSFPSSLMFSQSPFHVLKVGRHFVDRGSRTHVQIRADAHSSFIMHALV